MLYYVNGGNETSLIGDVVCAPVRPEERAVRKRKFFC